MLFRAGCQTSEVLQTSEVSAVARSRRWWVVLRGYGTQSVLEGIPTQSVGTIESTFADFLRRLKNSLQLTPNDLRFDLMLVLDNLLGASIVREFTEF